MYKDLCIQTIYLLLPQEEWVEELKVLTQQCLFFTKKSHPAKIVECDDIQITANLFIIAKRK